MLNFNAAVWEHERDNIVLIGSYAKFAQNPAMQQHLLGTGNRLLAEASPYDTIWGIGYRANHANATHPSKWRGLNLLGKTLQLVRQRLRDRAPPPARCHSRSPSRGAPPPQGQDFIFEVNPTSQQRLSTCDTTTAPSGYSTLELNVPSDHGGDVFSVTSTAGDSAPVAQTLAEQGPCLVPGLATMDHSSFTTKVKAHSGHASTAFGCVALLDKGSPQTFLTRTAWEHMVHSGAASTVCETQAPPRSWGGFGLSPPLADFRQCPPERPVSARRQTYCIARVLGLYSPPQGHAV